MMRRDIIERHFLDFVKTLFDASYHLLMSSGICMSSRTSPRWCTQSTTYAYKH